MRLFPVLFLRLALLATLASSAYAQMAWDLVGANGNSPVAFTYTMDSSRAGELGQTLGATRYLKTDETNNIISTPQQHGWLASSGATPILAFSLAFQDGGNAAAKTVTSSGGGNMFIQIVRVGATPVLVSDGDWIFTMTIPTTSINGTYPTGYSFAGGSDAGLANAFNFAFDGSGKITMTTTGNYTHSGDNTQYFAVNLTAVPEPATTVVLFSLIVGGMAMSRRRRRA